jgi:flagellar biosynthesis component FlhA
MTHWLYLVTNPVIYFVVSTFTLIALYLLYDTNKDMGFWGLVALGGVLFVALYMALSAVKDIRRGQTAIVSPETEIYQVFDHDESVLVSVGADVQKLTRHTPELKRAIQSVRDKLAERYGFVVPEIKIEFSQTLGGKEVAVRVRQELIAEFAVQPDCHAVPVQESSRNIQRLEQINGQSYTWIPQEELPIRDAAQALAPLSFLVARIESALLDHAHHIVNRTDALRLMAILQQQDVGTFHELFVQNQVTVSQFRHYVADMLVNRQSIRQIGLACERMLTHAARA